MRGVVGRSLVVAAVAVLVAAALWMSRASAGGWYDSQQLTPATQKRLGVMWRSCCKHGDVCHKCRFRVISDGSQYGRDQYQFWRGGRWEDIPPDIVHHVPTPNHAPILFLMSSGSSPTIPVGTPLCFKIDAPGG
jgi:hypothetical protein